MSLYMSDGFYSASPAVWPQLPVGVAENVAEAFEIKFTPQPTPVVRRTVSRKWAAKQAKAKRKRRIENALIVALLLVTGAGAGAIVTFEYGPVTHSHSKPVIKAPTYTPHIRTGPTSLLTEV